MWIKICGITTLEDAQSAVDVGADAVGFVFAPSPRRITPESARAIAQQLPISIEKIGVFVDASTDEIVSTCRTARLTGVQLHGESSVAGASDLRAALKKIHARPRIVQVVHYSENSAVFAQRLRNVSAQPVADDDLTAVLIDTQIAGKLGGTGVPFNWRAAQESLLEEAGRLRFIAAGGLRPDNVCDAIQTLRPWGVDVSSGVESSPGRKDRLRVMEFVRAAREAAAQTAEAARS